MISLLFSCGNKDVPLELIGTYTNDNSKLELLINNRFKLELPSISTIHKGKSAIKNRKLILKIESTDYKPFLIDYQPQLSIEELQLIVKGENWGVLTRADCKIQNNGITVESTFPNENGICKFKSKKGKLVINNMGYETAEIELNEIKTNSIIVTLNREKFKEKINKFEFHIEDENLIGITMRNKIFKRLE